MDLQRSSCPVLPAQAGPPVASCQDCVQMALRISPRMRTPQPLFPLSHIWGLWFERQINQEWSVKEGGGKGPFSLSNYWQLCTSDLRMEHCGCCPAVAQQTLPKEAMRKRDWFQRLCLHYQVAHFKRRGPDSAVDWCLHHINLVILLWTNSSLVPGAACPLVVEEHRMQSWGTSSN